MKPDFQCVTTPAATPSTPDNDVLAEGPLLDTRSAEYLAERLGRRVTLGAVTRTGLADAVTGADAIIDVTAGPSSEQRAATEFFTTAAKTCIRRASGQAWPGTWSFPIVGIEKSAGGYGSSKLAHEQAVLAGPVPARILRVTQFHELVGVLIDMGRQGNVIYLPEMRTQIIAARTVAEALASDGTSRRPGRPAADSPGRRHVRPWLRLIRPCLRPLGLRELLFPSLPYQPANVEPRQGREATVAHDWACHRESTTSAAASMIFQRGLSVRS
jgi:hypothetical protein